MERKISIENNKMMMLELKCEYGIICHCLLTQKEKKDKRNYGNASYYYDNLKTKYICQCNRKTLFGTQSKLFTPIT